MEDKRISEKLSEETADLILNVDLFRAAIQGAKTAIDLAKKLLDESISRYGPDQIIEYPETAYELPSIYALDGRPSEKLSDLLPILDDAEKSFQDEPSLEHALAAGVATVIAAEIIEALKYLPTSRPYEGTPYCGFIPDRILRELGVAVVDDTIPGVAVLVGHAKDSKGLLDIVRDLQSKGMLIFASYDIIDQLKEKEVRMGMDLMLYPVGSGTQLVHALNFAIRAALSFGGVQRGNRDALIAYLAKRPKVFILHFGPMDNIQAAAEFAALAVGASIVTNQSVEELPGKLIYEPKFDKMVQTAIEARDIRVKLVPVHIPVAYGPAFEGETIRRPETYLEAGGASKTLAFELLRLREEGEVEDGRVRVIGEDVDSLPEGSSSPLAIIVDVYGKKMQEDFEPVLERRIHQFINYAEGAWHTGQRNFLWIRLSKSAVRSGFLLKHFGEILMTKLKEEFGNIISRVQVTVITDENEMKKLLPEALAAYRRRDERMAGLTDERVDTYFSCNLCQSFAADHVCIITPERLGLCGALNWLDAKAGKEIATTGPNQPIIKGEVIDEIRGQWKGINEAVYDLSHHKFERFNAYSIMEDPMTSCGCFEVIVAMTADTQAVIVVNREYPGMTPIGMKFSTLAGSVGGGKQTPGFIGVGRKYLTSRKFIAAEGGFLRIAWMPKELKDAMKGALESRAAEVGVPDFLDKIADETITTTAEGLTEWMIKVDHPALKMPPLLS